MNRKSIPALVAILALMFLQFLATPEPAYAAACVWSGTVSTDWATTGNWNSCQGDGTSPPAATDTVTINSGGNQPTISSSVTIAGLTLNTGSTLTISADAALTVNGNAAFGANGGATTTLSNAGTFETAGSGGATFSRSDSSGTGNFALSGAGNWTFAGNVTQNTNTKVTLGSGNYYLKGNLSRAGTFDPGTSTITFNGGSTQSISGTVQHHFYNLVVANNTTLNHTVGAYAVNVRGDLTVEAGAAFNQAGDAGGRELVFAFNSSYPTSNLSGGGTFSFARVTIEASKTVNAGSASIAIGATTGSSSPWANSGTFNGQTGTVTFNNTTTTALTGGTNNFNNVVIGGTINFGSASVNVAGNWTNNATFTAGTSTVTFNGSSARSIGGTAGTTFNNLTINNSSGVTLSTSAAVNGVLALTSGNLSTGSNSLTLGSAATSSGSGDVVGTVTRSHTFTADTAYAFGNPYVTIAFTSAGTHPSAVAVALTKSAPAELTTAVQRYYTVTPTGGSGYSATLRLHYATDELNGQTEADLQLWRHDGSRWTLQPKTASSTSENWLERSGVTEFSNWAMASSGEGSPTGISLAHFSARAAPSGIGWGALVLAAPLAFVVASVVARRRGRRSPTARRR